MEWEPAASDVVENVAAPALKVPAPKTAPPSRNCTLPVAVAGVTCTVKVTAWPNVDGFAEEVSVTLDTALATVWVNVWDVLVAKFASPL